MSPSLRRARPHDDAWTSPPTLPMQPIFPVDAVAFWREAGPELWFAKDGTFDRRFRHCFSDAHDAAASHAFDHWMASAYGSLALILLLDQYPRNAFRGSPRMYATDEKARRLASTAIELGHDRQGPQDLRLFYYLPFGHSEDLVDQDLSVSLAHQLGEPYFARAKHHREIVRRFGRFPHRNAILSRESTAEELHFLANGGFAE